jgi:hypothetical protein
MSYPAFVPPPDELRALLDQGLSDVEIGEHYGHSVWWARKHRNELGLPCATRMLLDVGNATPIPANFKWPYGLAEFEWLLKRGIRQRDIADRLGMSYATVRGRLRYLRELRIRGESLKAASTKRSRPDPFAAWPIVVDDVDAGTLAQELPRLRDKPIHLAPRNYAERADPRYRMLVFG